MADKNSKSLDPDNYFDNTHNYLDADYKEKGSKHVLSKFEFDLFDEEKAKPNKVIRIKRSSTPTKGENWKLMEDDKVMLVVPGERLLKKEKEFLRSVEGINFVIKAYKLGAKSVSDIKKEISKFLKK